METIPIKRTNLIIDKKKLRFNNDANDRLFKDGYNVMGMLLYACYDISDKELAKYCKPAEIAAARKMDFEKLTENFKHTHFCQRLTYFMYERMMSENDRLLKVKEILKEQGFNMIVR